MSQVGLASGQAVSWLPASSGQLIGQSGAVYSAVYRQSRAVSTIKAVQGSVFYQARAVDSQDMSRRWLKLSLLVMVTTPMMVIVIVIVPK